MAIYAGVGGSKKVTGIFANIGGEKKNIKSVWANKDGAPCKVWSSGLAGFVCVGSSGKSYYSANGKTWTAMTGLNASYKYNGVTYGNDRFVCVGAAGKSYYSTDGKEWHEMTGAGSGNIQCVTYGEGKFICMGGEKAYYSADGETWTSTGFAYSTSYTLHSMVYISGFGFICVGSKGKSYYSADGVSWQEVTGLSTSYDFYSVTASKTRIVCVGGSGKCYYKKINASSSWTSATTLAAQCQGVTYGNGRFVAVGSGGASYYSTNGTTWTAMTGLASKAYSGVTYGNGRFVATGYQGNSHYSTDGKTWTAMEGLDNTGNYSYGGVAYSVDGGYEGI